MSAPDPLPFEVTRGGFTFGMSREISDDDPAAMFVVGGEIAPMLWAAQAFPKVGDFIQANAIGVEGELLVVVACVWQESNLVMIGCRPHDDSEAGS